MVIIENSEELNRLSNGNKFIGVLPEVNNSKIVINGENNILYCESNVKIVNSELFFNGSNSIIYLCSNKNAYYLMVSVNNDCALFIGKNNYFNSRMNIILSEHKHCVIGNNGVYSFGIWIRNADAHLIYDIEGKKRINNTKSVFIGDHVWIGQSALIMKGTQIDSGSIIGAMSVVSGKKIPANTSYAGNPCKEISKKIFWERIMCTWMGI